MQDNNDGLLLRWINYLNQKFPQLPKTDLTPHPGTLNHTLETYFRLIPYYNAQAKNVAIKNTLYELLPTIKSKKQRTGVLDKIALIEIELGLHSLVLKKECSDSVLSIARQCRELYNERYGAIEAVPHHSTRGASVTYYYKENTKKILNKRILHIAPEPEFRSFLETLPPDQKPSYETGDPNLGTADHFIDMAKIYREDACYDLVICHRVLEHVYSDAKALSEAFRLLRKGGCLNISVPIAFENATTVDWYIPDPLTHGHVRQYGADFPERLRAAGFDVQEERWLLTRTAQELAENAAFPMLMYNAYKR